MLGFPYFTRIFFTAIHKSLLTHNLTTHLGNALDNMASAISTSFVTTTRQAIKASRKVRTCTLHRTAHNARRRVHLSITLSCVDADRLILGGRTSFAYAPS